MKYRYSRNLVRDLGNLASLSKDLEETHLQGKMGRKAVLKIDRKKKNSQIEAKIKEIAPAKVAQNNPKPGPLPAITNAERQARIDEGAAIAVA